MGVIGRCLHGFDAVCYGPVSARREPERVPLNSDEDDSKQVVDAPFDAADRCRKRLLGGQEVEFRIERDGRGCV